MQNENADRAISYDFKPGRERFLAEILIGLRKPQKELPSKYFYDEKGAVGRRYRRQDEAGTPFCITVDGQTFDDNTVTVRERDSMEQIRIATDKLLSHLREKLDL